MKKFRWLSLFMAFSMIFCFYGMGFAGGGGPDPGDCPQVLPDPDAGKFLRGDFTVSKDKGPCSNDPECVGTYPSYYTTQVVLKWGNQEHLYSFISPLGFGSLCDITSEQLKTNFEFQPCNSIDAQNDFGLSGIPVITNLEITQGDFCSDSFDQMIRGEIVIRVVPIAEQPFSE